MKIKKMNEIIENEIFKEDRLKFEILKINCKNIFDDMNIKIEYIKDNIIYIFVDNSIKKHYIYANKEKILNDIKEETKKINYVINDIIVNVR